MTVLAGDVGVGARPTPSRSAVAVSRPGVRRHRLVLMAAVVALGVVVGPGADPGMARPLEGAGSMPAPTDADVGRAVARFDWPVPGRVVAAWDPPPTPYTAGHRGVDLAVHPGERVAAMADGVVGWAGVVAGVAWISVDHPGGIRTTVGPVATIAVDRGQQVARGQVLGTATGRAHVDADGLHVSARLDGVYIDPTSLVDVRLVPALLAPPEVRLGSSPAARS